MAHYMQNHLSFEKITDLAREYFLYLIQTWGILWMGIVVCFLQELRQSDDITLLQCTTRN
jgi:hypothetical protein